MLSTESNADPAIGCCLRTGAWNRLTRQPTRTVPVCDAFFDCYALLRVVRSGRGDEINRGDRTCAIEGSYTIFALPSLELWCQIYSRFVGQAVDLIKADDDNSEGASSRFLE
jgi:hypothetical protein